MDVAAETGRLDVLIWLHENRTEGCSHMAPWHAAEIGHLEMVKWLHEHYSDKFTARALDVAAANGHLDVVQWLHENRPVQQMQWKWLPIKDTSKWRAGCSCTEVRGFLPQLWERLKM